MYICSLIEEFCASIKSSFKFSKNSFIAYSNDLMQFNDFLRANCSIQHFEDITADHISDYKDFLLNVKRISMSSINRKLISTRAFFKFFIKNEFFSSHAEYLFEHTKLFKTLPHEPVSISESQMFDIIENYDYGEGFEAVRNKLIMITFFDTGVRLSELIALTDKNIDFKEKKLKVLGKGRKWRLLPLTDRFFTTYNQYVLERSDIAKRPKTLFITEHNTPCYATLIQRIVKKVLQDNICLKQYSPHVLRHSFATKLYNKGLDVQEIQEMLGHKNIETTLVYVHPTFDEILQDYKNAHPHAK